LHDLNIKFTGHNKLISDTFGAVSASKMKLKLFWKELGNVNLRHVSSFNLLHKDGSVSALFPSVPAVDMIFFFGGGGILKLDSVPYVNML
jgi:hypothetical protein